MRSINHFQAAERLLEAPTQRRLAETVKGTYGADALAVDAANAHASLALAEAVRDAGRRDPVWLSLVKLAVLSISISVTVAACSAAAVAAGVWLQ